jgi:translocation and assembly module TamA
LVWDHHLLSARGDNFDLGLGWQQEDNEFSVQANYRLPRKTRTRQFWHASFGLKSEEDTLKVSDSGEVENRFDIARGTITDYSLRLGKTRVHDMQGGYEQMFETIFVELLSEDRDLDPTAKVDIGLPALAGTGAFNRLLENNSNSMAVGMEWDWPEIRGTGFPTTGHHERARVLTANDAWGSDVEYSQVYLSSRWNLLPAERWKLLLRAEAGYSDASTDRAAVAMPEGALIISITELPNLYRFRAGGSRSVRGYAFESLDDNGLGSNNMLTASAEIEYQFREKWSAAAFMDIGNAFNDWSDPDLKLGAGFGIRWYTRIGALRLDFAQGRNLEGDPWRVHLTIGTSLL